MSTRKTWWILALLLVGLALGCGGSKRSLITTLDGTANGDQLQPGDGVADGSNDTVSPDVADVSVDLGGEDQLPGDLNGGEDGLVDQTAGDVGDTVAPDVEPADTVDDTSTADLSDLSTPDLSDVSTADVADLSTPDTSDVSTADTSDAGGPLVSASHVDELAFCDTDHGFALFGALANFFLAAQVENRSIAFVLRLLIESNPTNNALSWYSAKVVGTPAPNATPPLDWTVKTSSQVTFDTVNVGNVAFTATKSGAFVLAIEFEGVPFALTVQSANLKAMIGSITADGFDLSNGTITGMVLEEDFVAAINAAKKYCTDNSVDNTVCPIVLAWDTSNHTIPGLYNSPLITFGDTVNGKPAASICFGFNSVPAKITGEF